MNIQEQMSRWLMPLFLLALLVCQTSSSLKMDSENTVLILDQIVTAIVWIFGAAAIIVAILLFAQREKENLKLLIAELVCTIVVGICLLILPFLDAKLSHFQDVRIGNDETDLTSAHKEIGGLSNQLSAATHQINTLSNDLAAAHIKPLKERLIDCLNLIDDQAFPALKSGRPVHLTGLVSQFKYNQLESLANEQGANLYIVFRQSNNGSMIVASGIDGPAANLDVDLLPSLAMP